MKLKSRYARTVWTVIAIWVGIVMLVFVLGLWAAGSAHAADGPVAATKLENGGELGLTPHACQLPNLRGDAAAVLLMPSGKVLRACWTTLEGTGRVLVHYEDGDMYQYPTRGFVLLEGK